MYTDAPATLGRLTRQQHRWARGSQYNTLRMLPWMARHAPVLAVFFLADIVVPFILMGSFVSWGVTLARGTRSSLYADLPLPGIGWQALLLIAGLAALLSTISLGVRFGRHFADRPTHLRYLPAFMLINTFVLMPIRVAGFVRMAHDTAWPGARARAASPDGA